MASFGKSEISHTKEHLEIHLQCTNVYPLEMYIIELSLNALLYRITICI